MRAIISIAGCVAGTLLGATAWLRAASDTAAVRLPAVAGLFYPESSTVLARTVDELLAQSGPTPAAGELKALICPHAGYRYSGPVAASAYRLLNGRHYDTVVVLGPSHYALFSGASVSLAQSFRTPLGDVPVAAGISARLAQHPPFFPETPCPVVRPDWWRQASCRPPEGGDTPHTWEHAIEVQLPFLQRTLDAFRLVPVVLGNVDAKAAANALEPFLSEKTLLIVSSDLSHYDTYEHAEKRDRRCLASVCALRPEAIAPEDACGAMPIRVLLHIAQDKGWTARLLDYRNNGDITGDKTHGVVGYGAVAFFGPPSPEDATDVLTPDQQRLLLGLARRALREAATTGGVTPVDTKPFAPALSAPRGCFVTLTQGSMLRGCIGNLEPDEPLARAVVDNTLRAALQDPRFPPVAASEIDRLEIEISVLTRPVPLAFDSPAALLEKLRAGRDGVVLRIGDRSATFLPQVWAQLPKKEEFLDHLAEKAGCPASAWRRPGVQVFVYQVEAFKESQHPEGISETSK